MDVNVRDGLTCIALLICAGANNATVRCEGMISEAPNLSPFYALTLPFLFLYSITCLKRSHHKNISMHINL